MKKKVLFSIIGISFLVFFTGSEPTVKAGVGPAEGLATIFTHNYCRCKSGGCSSGNAISFRTACAKSEDPILCNNYDPNCS